MAQRLPLIFVMLFFGTAYAAGFGPEPGAINGKCLLKINSKVELEGPCWVYLETDGSFNFNSKRSNVFVYVNTDADNKNEGSAYWNAGKYSHADEDLGHVVRDHATACWKGNNAAVTICAWKL